MAKTPLTKNKINQIVRLRQRGHSLPEIRKVTGHGCGTILKYIKGVKILPEFQELWENKRKSSIFRMNQQKRKATTHAEKLVKNLKTQERILIASCLYWAEGQKRDFSLSNTDPALIKVFVNCLKDFGIPKENLRVTIRIYEDLNKEKACDFWAKVIEIPKEKILNVNILKGKKEGKLEYGMCRVRVTKGSYLLKLLNAIKNIIIKEISPS